MTIGMDKMKSPGTAESIPASTRWGAGAACSSLAPPRLRSTCTQSGSKDRGVIPHGRYSSHTLTTHSCCCSRMSGGTTQETVAILLPVKSLRKRFPDPAIGRKPLAETSPQTGVPNTRSSAHYMLEQLLEQRNAPPGSVDHWQVPGGSLPAFAR